MSNLKAVENNSRRIDMTHLDLIYIISNNITGMGEYKYSKNLNIIRRIKWI